MCAQVGGDDRLSFSDFWSFGADDQVRSVAVASAALNGDLERLKDNFKLNDCSVFIQRPGVEEAIICQIFSNVGLFVSTWSNPLVCRERVKQTSQFAACVVLDGGTRIDGGF